MVRIAIEAKSLCFERDGTALEFSAADALASAVERLFETQES
jgi:hypothetical protein